MLILRWQTCGLFISPGSIEVHITSIGSMLLLSTFFAMNVINRGKPNVNLVTQMSHLFSLIQIESFEHGHNKMHSNFTTVCFSSKYSRILGVSIMQSNREKYFIGVKQTPSLIELEWFQTCHPIDLIRRDVSSTPDELVFLYLKNNKCHIVWKLVL